MSEDGRASQKSATRNSRRKPALESVSLRHAPRRPKSPQNVHLVQSADQTDRNTSSVSSMEVGLASEAPVKPTWPKDSSGESSNAEKWFEKSNNNVREGPEELRDGQSSQCWEQKEADGLDEPPFFIQRTSSEESPPEIQRQSSQEQLSGDQPVAKIFDDELDSGSEDFRSVIDDLTIENQRLKRRLKKYERLHNSHLNSEALFEVRVHNGLSAQKKRELEEMLRNFVIKMEQTPVSSTNYSSSKSHGPASFAPMQTADSGYNSMSMSGQNSSNHSGQRLRKGQASAEAQAQAELSKDIQNYLSDIPAGLQPQQSGLLSEKEKRKLVVRRLEQLFAGRDPSASGHQQPIQQEKLAQSAARADRRAQTAGEQQTEGAREARIMTRKGKDAVLSKQVAAAEPAPRETNVYRSDDKVAEQRPTRPLDLDPYRAQIPAENMEYIRHLGFSPPQFLEAQEDGHGWIYLNVLHNMAQLHLSNVTVDFVRKAVLEHSKKLEISADGRKLRWKGDASVTQTSSNNSPDHQESAGSKRTAVDGSDSAHHASDTSRPGLQSSRHKFAYSPLFARQDTASTSSGKPEVYQMSHDPVAPRSAALNSTLLAARAEEVPDAPMVFYKDLSFFLDMTGDPAGLAKNKQSAYQRMTGRPLGFFRSKAAAMNQAALDREKGPLSQLRLATEQSIGSQSSGSLNVLPDTRNSSPSSAPTPDPLDFEVSGLGGVYPADNFAINVRTKQNSGGRLPVDSSKSARRKAYPTLIRRMFARSHSSDGSNSTGSKNASTVHPAIGTEIMSSNVRQLPASRLPDGNYYHNSSDDEDEDMLDYESEDDSTRGIAPLMRTQQMDWAPGANLFQHSDTDSDADDDLSIRAADADDRSEESMDLLASAREADPEKIRVQEREFDSNVAERLAEEIPAGSSAATAEGGSGFNSPVLTRDAGNAVASQHQPPPPALSTAATIGSAAATPTPAGFSRVPSGAAAMRRASSGLKRQRRVDEPDASSAARAVKSPRRSPRRKLQNDSSD